MSLKNKNLPGFCVPAGNGGHHLINIIFLTSLSTHLFVRYSQGHPDSLIDKSPFQVVIDAAFFQPFSFDDLSNLFAVLPPRYTLLVIGALSYSCAFKMGGERNNINSNIEADDFILVFLSSIFKCTFEKN